jgi:transposase
MMGRQTVDQSQLFYPFNLERRIPERHLLRRINPTVTRILAAFREKLEPFYSEIGRPSIAPELMIRMLIVGYCYGLRFERKLCEEVELHLAYRWFCRLDLDDEVPDRGCSRSRPRPSRHSGVQQIARLTQEGRNALCHLKTHHRLERMRLRSLSGARDEFHLAAIVQNLKTLAKYIRRPMPHEPAACVR